MSRRFQGLIVPVASIVLGLLIGAIIMLAFGYDPIAGYSALAYGAFGNSYYLGETLRLTTPYILTGLAIAVAYKMNMFNIGAQGQLLMGWIGAVWAGTLFDFPKFIHLPMAIVVGGICGAIWALVPGLLKAYLKVNEVIITIMMNYIALYIFNWLIHDVFTDGKDQTDVVKETASLKSPFLENITQYSTLHWGIILSLIFAVIIWVFMKKTTKGYEFEAIGFNENAAMYAGMNVRRNIIFAMLISGFLAGTAGAMEGLGTFGFAFTQGSVSGIGFDGIAVALLGALSPIGIVFSAFLFAALNIGKTTISVEAGIPNELVNIVIALIIFFVAASYIIQWVIAKMAAKKGGR